MPCRHAIAAALCLLAGPAAAGDTLTILHTNDFHARFAPVDRHGAPCTAAENAAGRCLGGAARLATAIAAARARAETALLVDAGDQFQGTLFFNHYKGRLAAEIMTRLGYDAMAVGNHEFDEGPGTLRRFIDAVDFPVLSANTDVSGTSALNGAITKSAVIARGGVRLGLIGLTPRDTAETSRPGPGVGFSDPVAAVRREVGRLTEAGVERIVVLSHSGYGADLRIARQTRGVDVIVGGHSHTWLANDDASAAGPYPTMVDGTAVVQAAAHGMVLGELTVTFDDAGRVTHADGGPRVLDAGMAEDAGIKARIDAAARPLEALRSRVVAEATAPIAGGAVACRIGECQMGTLVADAMLDRVRDQGIDVALQNGGGLRAGIDKGPVTMAELMRVLPFRNTLATFRVTGATLLAALEHGVGRFERGEGRFPQVAGMRFAVDVTAPPGRRVRAVTVGGAPFDPDRVYGVVTNDFLRGGGDGYDVFRQARDAHDFGPDLVDVTAEYLAENTPYKPRTHGRIGLVAE